VNPPAEGPTPYRVVYSEFVRRHLEQLHARAVAKGLGKQVLDALKEMDRLLHIYPQFGEPLRDLKTSGESVWIGTVGPRVAQYVLDEERRLVFIIAPFQTLPGLGL
jgi:hypothetical protein